MGLWQRIKSIINNGNEYQQGDSMTVDQLNAIVNNSLHAVDFAEGLADPPDVSDAGNVGTPTVQLIDNTKTIDGVTKTVKKFKFSNLKGETGATGATGATGPAVPLATAQGTETDKAPTNKLLRESTCAAFYRSLTEIDPTFTIDTDMITIITAMANNSIASYEITGSSAVYPDRDLQVHIFKVNNNRVTCFAYRKVYSAEQQYFYVGGLAGSVGSTYRWAGWRRVFTTDNISTVMPLSSAAASNEKVYSEKLAFDQLALKANANNPTFTGTVTVPTPSNNTDAATKGYVDNQLALKAPLANPTFTGTVTVPDATVSGAAVNKGQLDLKANDNAVVKLTGDQTIAGVKTFSSSPIVPTPTNESAAVPKSYVDALSYMSVYDLIIASQAQFDAFVASANAGTLTAETVAIFGSYTFSTAHNHGIYLPHNIKLQGFNAKITITNYDQKAGKAAIYCATSASTTSQIRDIELIVIAGGDGYDSNPIALRNFDEVQNCKVTVSGPGSTGADTSVIAIHSCARISNCDVLAEASGVGSCAAMGIYLSGPIYATYVKVVAGGFVTGFKNCSGLTGCTAHVYSTAGSGAFAFRSCYNLTGCSAKAVGASEQAYRDITGASNCSVYESGIWYGTNKGIDVDSCRKTAQTADNTTLNA